MLQHHPEPEPTSSPSLSANPDFTSIPIETYLDTISPPVEAALTAEAQRERRAEMKTHIESLIAAYIELGDTPEQAFEKACRQFGDSRSVQTEWKRTTKANLRQSLGTACALTGVSLPLLLLMLSNPVFTDLPAVPFFLCLSSWAVPAGFGTGFLARHRPVSSACRAQSLLSALFLWFFVQSILWPKAVEYVQDMGLSPSFITVGREILFGQHNLLLALGVAVLTGVSGVLTGTVAAGFGGWLRKQNQRLRQPSVR